MERREGKGGVELNGLTGDEVFHVSVDPLTGRREGLLGITHIDGHEETLGGIGLFEDEHILVGIGRHLTLTQGGMVIIEADERLVLTIYLRLGSPVDGHIFEEVDGLGIAYLLGTVDEGTAMGEDAGDISSHSSTVVGELDTGRSLRRVVVVGGEAQLDLAVGQTVVLGLISLDEVLGRSTLEHLDEFVFIVPAVVHVEAADGEVVRVLTLCEHENLTVAGGSAQLVYGIFPEVGRHTVGHITTEAVDAHVDNPELHGVDHGSTHILVVIVQVCHVFPVPGLRADDGVGLLVVSVPVRMCLHPGMIPGGVVGHPVEDDAHAVLMAYLSEILEVVDGAELRGNGFIVADAVGGVLALFDADGVDGHDPHDVDAQVADRVDAPGHGIEGVVRCEHAGVDLVHRNVVDGRHLEGGLFRLLRRTAGDDGRYDADG